MERVQVNLGIELSIKCVVVGDNCAQKSQFLLAYMTNKPPGEYVPTVFDNFSTEVEVEGHRVNLGLWDTAGQEEYDRLRSLAYPQADVFLLMFSIGHPLSLANIKTKWWREITHHCPDTPFLLVGNNMEMRTDPDVLETMRGRGQVPVSYEDGLKMAYEIGAFKYLENSALNCFGMREVIDEAVRVVLMRTLTPKKKSKRKMLVSSLIPQPPPFPKIDVSESSYLSDWMALFNKKELADVCFTFKNDDRKLWAHKVLLCSSAEVMRLLFMGNTSFTLRKRALKKSKSDGGAQDALDKRRSRHGSDVRKTRNSKKIPSLEVPNGSPKKVSPVESPRENGSNNSGPESAGHLPGYYTNREILFDTKEEQENELNNSPSSSPASSYSFNSLRSSANTTLKASKSEVLSPRFEALKPRRLRRGTESRIRHIKSDEIDLDELFGEVTQESDGITTVVVNKAKYDTFSLLVKFLYGVKLDDHFRQHSSELKDIAATAALYHCSKLAEYCLNVWIGAEMLNTSIKVFFDDEKKNSLQKYFLATELWTDVEFNVDSKEIRAHKVILASRCSYFNAMFTGEFIENKSNSISISDICCDALQQFVNFLYTDQCIITSNNVADLLMLSNKYGLTRLTNLCEQFVAANLGPEDSPEIIVEVLNFALQHNGNQLVKFCLHWLAVNHVTYEGKKEILNSLCDNHRNWIEKHRWPHKTEVIGLSKQLAGEDSREGKCVIQ